MQNLIKSNDAILATAVLESMLDQYEINDFESTHIDSDVTLLSSVKLMLILRLNVIQGCELENSFIDEIELELLQRGGDRCWKLPH